MSEIVIGPIGEFLGLALYIVAAGVLTVLGALAELASLQNLSTGQSILGLWEAAFGMVLLYAAFMVVSEYVLPRLRESVSSA